MKKEKFKRINDWTWEAKKEEGMRVPARVYASRKILEETEEDALGQLMDIARIPGIVSYALAMPDIHSGYGPPIGGVGAMDKKEGVISPAFIGFDQNCGVRILTSQVKKSELKGRLNKIAEEVHRMIPAGLGKGGGLKLSAKDIDNVLEGGAPYLVSRGWGEEGDIERCEERGRMKEARADLLSRKSKERGKGQLGTLGSGNHFLEIQEVKEIFDEKRARDMGLFKNQVVFMIHTGSRGLGHQNCSDYLEVAKRFMKKSNMPLINKDLTYFPFYSEEGQKFFGSMASACNYAWANRQVITSFVRDSWKKIFGKKERLMLLYDVAHNIAKIEKHEVKEEEKELIVHRKGATRAFPEQPVIIPGSMGTSSYVLSGTKEGSSSFYSTSHGAGRRLSRKAAKKTISGKETIKRLEKKGIMVKCTSVSGISEEAPESYKDIEEIIEVIYNAKLSNKVAKLTPLAVVKGE